MPIIFEFEGKEHRYYPDGYIRSTKTLVECKTGMAFRFARKKLKIIKESCKKLGLNILVLICELKSSEVKEQILLENQDDFKMKMYQGKKCIFSSNYNLWVDEDGNIYDVNMKKKEITDKDHLIKIKGKTILTYHLIALYFQIDGYEYLGSKTHGILHIDGNKNNNKVSNLKILHKSEITRELTKLTSNSKPVYQFDNNGNFIKKHESKLHAVHLTEDTEYWIDKMIKGNGMVMKFKGTNTNKYRWKNNDEPFIGQINGIQLNFQEEKKEGKEEKDSKEDKDEEEDGEKKEKKDCEEKKEDVKVKRKRNMFKKKLLEKSKKEESNQIEKSNHVNKPSKEEVKPIYNEIKVEVENVKKEEKVEIEDEKWVEFEGIKISSKGKFINIKTGNVLKLSIKKGTPIIYFEKKELYAGKLMARAFNLPNSDKCGTLYYSHFIDDIYDLEHLRVVSASEKQNYAQNKKREKNILTSEETEYIEKINKDLSMCINKRNYLNELKVEELYKIAKLMKITDISSRTSKSELIEKIFDIVR